jgi:hypothetical protein
VRQFNLRQLSFIRSASTTVRTYAYSAKVGARVSWSSPRSSAPRAGEPPSLGIYTSASSSGSGPYRGSHRTARFGGRFVDPDRHRRSDASKSRSWGIFAGQDHGMSANRFRRRGPARGDVQQTDRVASS